MLTNRAEFSLNELIVLFGEENIYNVNKKNIFTGVSTDTRKLKPDNIFVPLKGEKIDGHTKINEAFQLGAGGTLADKKWFDLNNYVTKEGTVIVVDNTLSALGKLANHHRRKFVLPIIAVAGSNGKTTTKELIAHLLSQKYNVLKTFANFNNQIGVPLMLLQLDRNYDIAVIEIGTNLPGEVAILSEMVDPTAGIITNIGEEHLEMLIDLDGVELEETYLFGYLIKKGGKIFLNADDVRLNRYSRLIKQKLTFGQYDEANVKGSIELDRELHPRLSLKYEDRVINATLQLTGYTNGLNALAAAAVAFDFGLDDEQIIQGLTSFTSKESHSYARMTVESLKNFLILNDCYNANPPSMRSALAILRDYPAKGRRIAVLGDMLEMGQQSIKSHIEIIKLCTQAADAVFLLGEEMEKAAKEINNKHFLKCFADKNELTNYLKSYIKENDIILIKGSRGMKMEEIIIELKNFYNI